MIRTLAQRQPDEPVVALAPMSGVTDRPFRRLAYRFGADLVFSEMIAGAESLRGRDKSRHRLERGDDEGPFLVQLAGCRAEVMAEAARYCADRGADAIDINMGCPVKKVIGGMAGSALMRTPDEAARLVEAVVGAVDLPVSVKMRTGWDRENRNAPELARLVERAGAAWITVHGRTREQKYSGRADWDFIARVKQAVAVPVLANGDVTTLAEAREILARSGADGLLIGRGSYGRPWRVGGIARGLQAGRAPREPDGDTRLAAIEEQLEGSLALYGGHRGLRHFRKHLGWYLERMGAPAALRREALTADRPETARACLRAAAGAAAPVAA